MQSQTSTKNAEARAGSGEMFDGIADRYDLLNRVISLGIDQGWRRKTVAALELEPGHHVMDLATGTADLAIMIARKHPVDVVGVDPSAPYARCWPQEGGEGQPHCIARRAAGRRRAGSVACR